MTADKIALRRNGVGDLVIELASLFGVGLKPEHIKNKRFLKTMGITRFHRFWWLPSVSTFTGEDIANKLLRYNRSLDLESARAQIPELVGKRFYINDVDYYYFEEVRSKIIDERRYRLYCYTPDP